MKNIALIGMAGCGKSTVGVLLAKALGMPFIDIDLIIQEQEGKLLQDIINHSGIKKFLDIEEKAILSLDIQNTVIATGGSVAYSNAGMIHLKRNGIMVYLKLDFEEIRRRIDNITTRGIVIEKGRTLLDTYKERIPLYEKYADITLDCNCKSVEESLEELIYSLKR